MAEYIEREAAMPDNFCVGVSCQECPFCDDPIKGGCKVARFIDAIPAADVAPVRHGRWIWELADNGWANHICSECGYTKNTDIHVRLGYDYCPNCGAKMDGGKDDD